MRISDWSSDVCSSDLIREAARVLMPGGRLLIADFAPHDVEELRTRDAHARLGFSDEQMLGWFEAAGLLPARNETLEGGELNEKLWLVRKDGAGLQEGKAARARHATDDSTRDRATPRTESR